jgi:triacylglycerol esterase/lipase EstA (alpha/beta hydrolase family)
MFFRNRFAVSVLVSGLLASGCADTPLADDGLTADESEAAPEVLAQRVGAKRPIVAVAGLMQDANTLAPLTKALKAQGFDVTLFVPPDMGMGDINDYAAQLGKTVDGVVRKTGARKVDLIGHSEGGLTARRYVQTTERAPVHTLISMGTPQQGTEVLDLTGDWLLDPLLKGFTAGSVALQQMTVGSMFLVDLNDQNDPTPGDVRYLAIGTEKDGVTQPVARSAIPGAEHVVMQTACPGRNVGHFGLLEDAWVRQVILSVLAGGKAVGDCRARPIGGGI